LMVETMDEVLDFAETVVIGNGEEEFRLVVDGLRGGQVLIDLVRISDQRSTLGKYDGICW